MARMNIKILYSIGLFLLSVAVVVAAAEEKAALAGSAQRQLLQVPPRFTGLRYPQKGLQSAPNITRRLYSVSRDKAAILQNLGAGTNATQIARAACSSDDILDPECIDVLLLALTPSSYSSNETRDTPGRRSFIGPAQDQGRCSSCVGFAVTAAAEAAINVHRQQSWRSFNLSEQDLSFCKLTPRVNCITGASYEDVVRNFLKTEVSSWASRSCWGYSGDSNKGCPSPNACSNQLSTDAPLSWAYNANALDTMAKVKQRIMLSGGVITSMAMSDAAFQQFQAYAAAGDAVYSPSDDLASASSVIMHAIFCYGWWDNATNTEEGWWLCKNSWGPSWGPNGSFKIAYGAAYIMQPDYTFAFEVRETLAQVQQRFAQALSFPATPGCLLYFPKQPQRLMKLADDLTTLAALVPETTLPQVLAEVVTSNTNRIGNLSAAVRGPFRLCGNYLRELLKKGARAFNYTAICMATNGSGVATWQVTGGCSTGTIRVQAEPYMCVTARSVDGDRQQVHMQACGGSLSHLQQFEYKEGQIRLKGTLLQLTNCKRNNGQLFFADFMPYLEGRAGVVPLKYNTNLCVAAPMLGELERAELQPCSSSNSRFVYQLDGSLRWDDSQWCLDVFGFNASAGAEVVVEQCNGKSNQRWWKGVAGELRPWHALDLCLGTLGASVRSATPLQLWSCNTSKAQLFATDWMPTVPDFMYLGCFRSGASAPVLPDLLSEELTASKTTEQCWQHAAGSLTSKNELAATGQLAANNLVHPLFGVSGRNCFGGWSLAQATAMGPAPGSDCATGNPDVVALYQLVPPGGPIPRGCVTEEKSFRKGLPVEEYLPGGFSYARARALALMKGAKYFAVARRGLNGHSFTFGAEPTTAPLLNVTVNGSLGCYTPCDDDASKACGSSEGFGGATAPRVWFVYEFPA
uniref:Peptidase C1A papain C-terminal domain-containing protein n=1 Tax=Tetradesmus obliquus TaxID=3088 RepID=A0A383W290_TETOB|eukprot:jgi/Sobl393_1/18003/SZX71259.1